MEAMSRTRQLIGLAAWLSVTFVPAWLGSQVTNPEWYGALDRPSWAPPSSVFGPVWTALYLLMAVAAWLVWRRHGFGEAGGALGLYLAQLAFNAAWSWIFFGLNLMGLAFAELVVLWLVILATILAFFRADRVAGWLLVPYLLWVTYAGALNFAIWTMNG